MNPELNLDLARHHIADRLRRAEHRALVDRQLGEGRDRQRRWRRNRHADPQTRA